MRSITRALQNRCFSLLAQAFLLGAVVFALSSVRRRCSDNQEWLAPVTVASWEGNASTALQRVRFVGPLRSAFLVREVGSFLPGFRQRPEDLRENLQQHFDAVSDILVANAEASVETALDRLEQEQGDRWSLRQRQAWRARLIAERELNLSRLQAYRDRGVFPRNEGHADFAIPIFVDKHDTACAVGHLMRCAGWESEVAGIAATQLFVYVPDVESGPLVDWVLTSGLTQEEAALIQPGYDPPPSDVRLDELLNTGESVAMDARWYDTFGRLRETKNGLVFENFEWQVLPGVFADNAPPTTEYMGVRTDFDTVQTGGIQQIPYSPDFSKANIFTTGVLFANERTEHPTYLKFSFDVITAGPIRDIHRVGVWLAPGFNFGRMQVQTVVVPLGTPVDLKRDCFFDLLCHDFASPTYPYELDGDDALGDITISGFWDNPDSLPYAESASIDRVKQVTVHSLIRFGGDFSDAYMGGLSHTIGFVGVPEPSSVASLLAFAVVSASSRLRGLRGA